jgi:CheY-like chemotaxis protein
MKLLIIAGPYEADRIRKAAVAGGFEAVAVEPGESLSGWITASRPEVIVMAPQMVHPDPTMALAKVRAVPRGRVPIFFVGDSADEPRMTGLADGFFVRPISPEELVERARTLLTEEADKGNGARRRARTAEGLGPFPQTQAAQDQSGPMAVRPVAGLKPLRASPAPTAPKAHASHAGPDATMLLAELTSGIDALLDAELSSVIADEEPVAEAVADVGVGEREFADQEVTADSRPAPPAPADRDTLMARAALVDEGDYFEVLGVGRDATDEELRHAHERIARELAPEAIDAALSAELGDRLDAMREVVAEALRVLTNDRLRSRYLAHLG